MRRPTIALIATVLTTLLAGGLGCNEPADTAPDTGTPDANGEAPSPIADFDYEPQTITVGQPVTLDASSSEPVDGSLRFEHTWTIDSAWTLTGEKTVHIFATPGVHTVELMVDNAGWKSTVEHQIVVEPAPALGEGSARVDVRVTNHEGEPLRDASVRVLGRDESSTIGATGHAQLYDLPTDTRLTLVIDSPNASARYETVVIPEGVSEAAIDVAVRPVIDRAAAPADRTETLEFDGLRLEVPEGSFVDPQGQPLRDGEVHIEVTRFVGPRDEAPAVPGSYDVLSVDGTADYRFVGGLDIRAYHDGAPARLAPGRTLELVVPATYPATYEGLSLGLLHLEPHSGLWLRTSDVVTELTEQSPTRVGAAATIPRLGAWALGFAHPRSCQIEVRCQDGDGTPLDSCTVRANLQGIDGVGRLCEPSALTEGVRCQSDLNCVNCELGGESVTGNAPSAPCYISPQGNSICPSSSSGGRVDGQRSCTTDRTFSCEADPSGLGHCIQQVDPSCGLGSQFCDVHRVITDTPNPSEGVCTAPQTDFLEREGIYSGRRITDGGTIVVPHGRLQLTAIGPDSLLRGESDVVGRSYGCPTGPVTIDVQ